MNYGKFPLITRRPPGTNQPFQPVVQPFLLDLFIDKPALMGSHVYGEELFAGGINEFDPVADQLNQIPGGVEWLSLGDIIKRLYLEKVNDGASVDVHMYTNDLILTNESKEEQIYHITKEETQNVPIITLTVNGHEFPFRTENGLLFVDVRVPADFSVEVPIHYED